MKTRLEMYFQQAMGNVSDCDETGLGIEAMLGQDVVGFLATNQKNSKPLNKRSVSFKQNASLSLDEHELAMV